MKNYLTLFAAIALLSAAASAKEPLRVENVRFEEYQPGWVSVYYDLQGDPGTYTVDLAFRPAKGEGRVVTPVSVQQDVGKGVSPGSNKRILWRLEKDYPQGFPSDQYIALVTARQPGKMWP
jgi:hypothetical protein